MMRLQEILIAGALATTAAWSQSIISARSGLIHHTEGTVLLGDSVLIPDATEFPAVGEGQLLRVGQGRAEILLTPGAVLRMGRNSAMRLLSNRLDDTRVALLAGTAMIEIDALLDDNRIEVMVNGGSRVELLKHGLYHFNADTGEFRVYDGKASVIRDDEIVTLKKGRTAMLTAALDVEKFDRDKKDDVYLWSQYRSRAMALANQQAAQSVGSKNSLSSNVWYWNRWSGMYTFLPASGTIRSPFGWNWYSPKTVWVVYAPRVYSPGFNMGGSSAGRSTWQGFSSGGGASASSVAPSAGVAVRSSSPTSAPAAPSTGRSR